MVEHVAVIGMTENMGGIESVIMNIYRNLDREKIQFDFLLPHDMGKMAYEDEDLDMGGRIFRIIYSERESFLKARKCFENYFKEHPETKAVHLHTNFPYAFPLKMAKRCKVPVRIIHAHNSVQLFESGSGLKHTLKKIRNYMVYKQVDKYPNIYFSCSDLAAKSTFRDNQYVWIKNGIELNEFMYSSSVRENLRNKIGINQDEVVVGCVGRLCDRKNPLYVLEIFNEYLKINSKAHLIIVGDGELREIMENKIKEYNIGTKVHILGMVADANKWYQAFDVFVLPSLFEGLPVVLVEAQTAGLPCIVSDTVTKQVAITDLVKYRSINLEPTEWAKDIDGSITVQHDREKYKQRMAEEGFDIKDMAKQVEYYYIP